MASYDLKWKLSAERELRNLPNPVIFRLTTLIQGLKDNPHPHGAKKMAGTQDTWRVRDGDYRVIYRILGNILTIEITRVDHRREVYQ